MTRLWHGLTMLLLIFPLLAKTQLPVIYPSRFDNCPPGYYFLKQAKYQLILNEDGEIIFYRKTETDGFDFTLWPNGLLSFADRNKTLIMDSTFNIIDSVVCKNYETDIHEFRILPNGHFLVLGLENTVMNLSQYCWAGEYGSDSAIVKSAVIQEQDKNHNILFEWHSKNYFSFDEADTFFLFPQHTVVDWMHVNALDMDVDGNIIMSIRNFNQIVKIDKNTGEILWRLGGKLNQFKFKNSTIPFWGQHDVRIINNKNITLYDGGSHPFAHGARGMEFKLNAKSKTAELVWSYTYNPSISSNRNGSLQRLHNNYTLINYGYVSSDSIVFTVTDNRGKKLFELKGQPTYRVFNYINLPWQLKQPQIITFQKNGLWYIKLDTVYKSYQWNTGETSPVVEIHPGQTYFAYVPFGQGGFIKSEKFTIEKNLIKQK